ncbi:MAG: hypothetical protein EOO60_05340 [Hymenobacter sp.]|nr:MAG: hypothetical protein EOO60_05340 [Hymenobacter sp.]
MLLNPAISALNSLSPTSKLAEGGAQGMPIGCVRQASLQDSANQNPRPSCKAKACPGTYWHKRLPNS